MQTEIDNKHEQGKFDKEIRMAMTFAQHGHNVELIEEVPGISSPDAIIDGVRVDFKSLSSANNIYRHAKDTIYKQGAEEVWFEFTNKTIDILKEIENLKKKGFNGKYYFKEEGVLFDF